MSKGPCMLGKLNYYMGFRAAGEGRAPLYPTIDFCEYRLFRIMVHFDRIPHTLTFEWDRQHSRHDLQECGRDQHCLGYCFV
jgi:hypothetical protein